MEWIANTVPKTMKRGARRLQFDLVQELALWLEAKDAARLFIPVRVQ